MFVDKRRDLLIAAEKAIGCPSLAEDLIQESWIRWAQKDYKRQDALPILRTIIRNLAFDWSRRARLERSILAELAHLMTSGADSEDIAVARGKARLAAEVLAALPVRTRRAFVLRRVHGMTFDEIGSQLGVTNQRAHQMVKAALIEIDRRLSDD